jgi:glycosyltransferase involved in cell wall biosynthesis
MLHDGSAVAATPAPTTVLMATRNGAAYLGEQLESLAAQTDRNWQLWASDDGSTDGTKDILMRFAQTHPVRLLEGPRRGAAQNFLSLLTHPDLPPGPVAFADQDDVWLPGKLARARTLLAQVPNGRPALYAAESLVVDADLRALGHIRDRAIAPTFGNALVENLFSGHTMVLNAASVALARRIGVAEGIRFHDWWMYQLIAGAGGKLVLDPTPVALYRQHTGNLVGAASGPSARLHRARRLIFGQWRDLSRSQARALHQARAVLTPKAVATLDEYLFGFPQYGPARAAAFRRHGLMRAARGDGIALQICACFGLV